MKKTTPRGLLLLLMLTGSVGAGVSTLQAAWVLDWTSGGSAGSSSYTRGFSFSASTPFTVTALGTFDLDGNGLAASHDVGLWTSTGVLLVSGTVDSGTTDPLDGRFRYTTTLTGSVNLPAGDYVVGSVAAGDAAWRYVPAGTVVMASGFTFGTSMSNGLATFSFPDVQTSGFDVGYFGGNLQVSVPEPHEYALLAGLGLLGCAARRRHRASVQCAHA